METFIKNLAKGAGAILRGGFRTDIKTKQKTAPWDVVTKYDLASEEFIVRKIRRKYPDHGILSEESGEIKKSRKFWIIDPIDGTRPFSRGVAQFCVSISFVNHNQIELGCVYDPIADELFFAKRKGGAFLNGKRVHVTSETKPKYADAAILLGSHETTVREKKVIYNNLVIKYNFWPDRVSSAALSGAYVASGRFALYISKGLDPWDYSAAALMLKETGAKVTEFNGRPYKWNSRTIVAANPSLHRILTKELKTL